MLGAGIVPYDLLTLKNGTGAGAGTNDSDSDSTSVGTIVTAAASYKTYAHENCYGGHGGVQIDDDPLPGLTAAKCQQRCTDDPGKYPHACLAARVPAWSAGYARVQCCFRCCLRFWLDEFGLRRNHELWMRAHHELQER